MHQQSVFDDSQDEGPSRCSTVLYYTWKICTCLFSHVLLVSLVVTYCIMGAFTFSHLEAENELEVKKNISAIRSNVSDDLWLLTERSRVLVEENWTQAVEQRLAAFEKELVRCVRADGWDGTEDPATQQWTLSGALFYSIIVITTIELSGWLTCSWAEVATPALRAGSLLQRFVHFRPTPIGPPAPPPGRAPPRPTPAAPSLQAPHIISALLTGTLLTYTLLTSHGCLREYQPSFKARRWFVMSHVHTGGGKWGPFQLPPTFQERTNKNASLLKKIKKRKKETPENQVQQKLVSSMQ